ncbi:GNAT family N-acetyltransferase [Microbacterium sp. SYP-A9085]|uniref:GNAT family N-acetyltransferase n=1 Tax=Microbacterium sp. SYP-A9085 TaxID=2664454 RepID=UPI00129BDA2E|nr:GNAT family N-acetyltransferase [Microbacterium sp. SYP-A9085]MRH28295.1 GNAT family N-acetyltransferase [Microbacterium sp. SYP-A9085]
MGHIELRDLQDDDLDAVFEMLRDPGAVAMAAFTRADTTNRDSFDEWIAARRRAPEVSLHVVTERGGFAGIAGAFTVDGDREVTCWIARNAWGRGVGTEALRLLLSREPTRPLFARVAAHNTAAIAVLGKNGFTELSRGDAYAPGLGRDVEEVVYALLPVLE